MMKGSTSRTLAYFWRHSSRYLWLYVGMLLAIMMGVLANDIVVNYLYKELVDTISGYAGMERAAIFGDLLGILLMIVGTYLFGDIIGWRLAGYMNTIFLTRVIRDITDECFQRIHAHSLGFFNDNFVGSLVNKVKKIYRAFDDLAEALNWNIYTNVVRATATLVMLWWLAPVFALVFAAWMAIFILVIWIFSLWKMKVDVEESNYESKVTANLADTFTNAANIKTFTNIGHEVGRFSRVTDERRRIQKRSWVIDEYMRAFAAVSMISVEFAVFYYAIVLWTAGEMSVGSLVLLQALIASVMNNLWDFGRVLRQFYRAVADADEMMEILRLDPEIRDLKRPEKCKIGRGKIEFKDVDFSYGGEKIVFENFNLQVKAGEKLGIVGESGAGKSTLTKLLMRFVDVSKGQILIDGQDVRRIRQNDLRAKISFVPQDPILFHRSLKENIRYGRLDASDEEVMEAAKKAHAHQFIMGTRKGYDTVVGERGVKLSGGERQRIAIARAILADAPILILDEATSALDSKSEKMIQEALTQLMKGKTTLVIAHRLSTLRQMDEIIVFDQGVVAERGNHKILLRKKGKYAELWEHQAGGFIG